MRKFIYLIILLSIPRICLGQSSLEKKAEAAGKYWSAIIMADEFKKSYCGNSLNLARKWTDVIAAEKEIKNSFPASVQGEINYSLSAQSEASTRADWRIMWSKIDPNKCIEAQKIFYSLFDGAVQQWQTIK